MTGDENCATNSLEKGSEPSKRYQFRLKLGEALEVDEIIENEFSGSVTQFFKSLLSTRLALDAVLSKQAKEVITPVLELADSEIGLEAVRKAFGEHGYVILKRENWEKWKSGGIT